MKKKDISVEVNYPSGEESLREFSNVKVKIVISILREKYSEEIIEEYVNSSKLKVRDYIQNW